MMEEVTCEDPRITKIIELSKSITEAINQNKSVTIGAKKTIREASEEIIAIAGKLHQQPPPTTSLDKDDNIDKKLNTLRQELIAEINSAITTNIRKLKINPPPTPKPTYAAITSQPQKPAIVITPKNPTETTNTINAIKQNISFKNKTYAPSRIQPIAKGRVLLEFDNKQQCIETINTVNTTSTLKAEEARKRPPLAILKGISKHTDKEDLIETICNQNSLSSEDIRLCFLTTNRSSALYNAVIEIKPAFYHKLTGLTRVPIGHQQVHIEGFSRFVQCTKCLLFGHSRGKCPIETTRCAFCTSENHQSSECPQKDNPQCHNCITYNKRFGTKLDFKHPATNSRACPRILTVKKQVEAATDFGPPQPLDNQSQS